eukprot:4769258-Pleurochrysis_carterae.AAC.3
MKSPSRVVSASRASRHVDLLMADELAIWSHSKTRPSLARFRLIAASCDMRDSICSALPFHTLSATARRPSGNSDACSPA